MSLHFISCPNLSVQNAEYAAAITIIKQSAFINQQYFTYLRVSKYVADNENSGVVRGRWSVHRGRCERAVSRWCRRLVRVVGMMARGRLLGTGPAHARGRVARRPAATRHRPPSTDTTQCTRCLAAASLPGSQDHARTRSPTRTLVQIPQLKRR